MWTRQVSDGVIFANTLGMMIRHIIIWLTNKSCSMRENGYLVIDDLLPQWFNFIGFIDQIYHSSKFSLNVNKQNTPPPSHLR